MKKQSQSEIKKKNNEIYYTNIVNIESLFSTLKTVVPLTLLGTMLEYWIYSLIPIATIFFIIVIIASFISLITTISYIKYENKLLEAEVGKVLEFLFKKFNNINAEEFHCAIKKGLYKYMKVFNSISNSSFLVAMVLILITVIIAL